MIASRRSAPVRFAWARFDRVKLQYRSMAPASFAPSREALPKYALFAFTSERSARVRVARSRLESLKVAPRRFARVRSAPEKLAPVRSQPAKSIPASFALRKAQ